METSKNGRFFFEVSLTVSSLAEDRGDTTYLVVTDPRHIPCSRSPVGGCVIAEVCRGDFAKYSVNRLAVV